MSKPVILVLSRDQLLMSGLPNMLHGWAEVRACDSPEEMYDITRHLAPQALLADFRHLSGGAVRESRLLEFVRERFPGLRVAVVTGDECPEPLRLQANQADFAMIQGRVDSEALLRVFGPLFPEYETSQTRNTATAGAVEFSGGDPVSALHGITRRFETSSPQLRQMLEELEVAARHDVTILLIGETGSGKTFLARLIHEISPRRQEPFLPVACGALPSELIESEMFGHVKGAFTSAHADKEGKFIAAGRGSILLDEIDALGPEQQVKLLRVIETGEFEPVGSNHTQYSQARLIVASNLELQPLVEQSKFRPDLYYRLNMMRFVLPPLRQRKMDIVPLARKFIQQFSTKHQVRIDDVDGEFFQALLNYPWLGNVRELEHVIQRAVIYCRDGKLQPRHLPGHVLVGTHGPANDPTVKMVAGLNPPLPPAAIDQSLGSQIALTEREIIEQTLFKNNFSRTKTAKELGISRVTLYNKMKKYGM